MLRQDLGRMRDVHGIFSQVLRVKGPRGGVKILNIARQGEQSG